jgi:hypothetical protein
MNRAGDRRELREGESYCADASSAGLRLGERDDSRAPLVVEREREEIPVRDGVSWGVAETGARPKGFPEALSIFFLLFFFFFFCFLFLS